MTKGFILVLDDSGKPIATLVMTTDAQVSGYGRDLKEFLSDYRVPPPLPPRLNYDLWAEPVPKHCNGSFKIASSMYTLATQLVGYLTHTDWELHPSCYLYPEADRGVSTEYFYTVYRPDPHEVIKLKIEVNTLKNQDKDGNYEFLTLFDGELESFDLDVVHELDIKSSEQEEDEGP